MELVLAGLLSAFTPASIMYVFMGVFTGLAVGAIPGLSGPMAIALAVPLTYTMSPVAAIGFLVGINKGSCYGGSLAAILLNTPGSPEAAATTFDGYPLAQQGKGMKAIKLSLVSSVFGDTFSTLLLIGVAAPIASFAIKMGPSEIFSLIILALTVIAALESDSLAKGLLAAALGMLLSTIGIDQVVGLPRLTFDVGGLEPGLRLIGMAIGLLAISEMLLQLETLVVGLKGSKAPPSMVVSANPADSRLSWREFKSCLSTLFRSSAIGAAIGALPGLGASVAPFLAYGAAKKSSKHPEKFGQGALEGVAAPESANNAVVGAALIPLFTMGIPGSLAAALLIGVFIMHNMPVGPLMFEMHAQTVYGIYGTILIGNAALLVLGYVCIRLFTKILTLPKLVLLPAIVFICLFGAYLDGQSTFSVGVAVAFGMLGYLMKKLKFSFVCLVVGFILGPMLELSLQQMLISFSGNYTALLSRPATVVIALFLLAFLGWQFYQGLRKPASCPGDPLE